MDISEVSLCNDFQNKEMDYTNGCNHEYVYCENVFPLAVCCTKCGHMLVKNPDGTVSESYAPVQM